MDDDKNIRDWAVNHVHATLNWPLLLSECNYQPVDVMARFFEARYFLDLLHA
jgi:hypothetical protein